MQSNAADLILFGKTNVIIDSDGIIDIGTANDDTGAINIGTNDSSRIITIGNNSDDSKINLDVPKLILKNIKTVDLSTTSEITTNSTIIILTPPEHKVDITLQGGTDNGQIINIINNSIYKVEFHNVEINSKLKKTSEADYRVLQSNSALQCIWYDSSWYQLTGLTSD